MRTLLGAGDADGISAGVAEVGEGLRGVERADSVHGTTVENECYYYNELRYVIFVLI